MNRWLDESAMDESFRSDPDLMIDLVQIFRDLHPPMETQIELAIGEGNFMAVCEAAHMLKTRLRHLHLPALGKNAEELEHHARALRRSEMMLSYFVLKRHISEALIEIDMFLGARSR